MQKNLIELVPKWDFQYRPGVDQRDVGKRIVGSEKKFLDQSARCLLIFNGERDAREIFWNRSGESFIFVRDAQIEERQGKSET